MENAVTTAAVSTASVTTDRGTTGMAGAHAGAGKPTDSGDAAGAAPASSATLTPKQTGARAHAVLDEVERAVVGKRPALELVMLGVLAGGHVLIEDLPGLGKTLLARSFATALGLDFTRIQFTPDLLPSDVTGAPFYDQRSGEMVFRPGPVFTHLLLADEINRTPPKTQAALLEAMAEAQVSVDGATRPLPKPFVVIATDNPIEYEGTYALPEAQLDRFLLRVRMGYLPPLDEAAMLRKRLDRATPDAVLKRPDRPGRSARDACEPRVGRGGRRPARLHHQPGQRDAFARRRYRSGPRRAAVWRSFSWLAAGLCWTDATT